MDQLDELRDLTIRHATGRRTQTPLPGMTLLACDAPTEPVQAMYQPAFCVIIQGAKRTVLGNRICEYDGGKYLVVSVDLPVTGRVIKASAAEPYLAVAMQLDPVAVATLLLERDAGGGSSVESSGLAVSTLTPELLDPVVRLMRLLECPTDIPVLAPLIQREILWRLLASEQGAMVRQIGSADSHLAQIGRAIRWLRSNFAASLRIDDLARLTGMSAPSFYRHFRAVTAMSPLQYQKQIRLQEARALLIAQRSDVAGVGFEVGYDSPSQFSREYSRFFGAPPGKDAVRLRTSPLVEQSVA